MEIVGIHADKLAGVPGVQGGCHLVGQQQGPIADASQLVALVALAPAPTVTGVHGDAVSSRATIELGQNQIDYPFPQFGIADAELGLATNVSLAVNQRVVLWMFVEFRLQSADDAAVSVARTQLDPRGREVSGAPIPIGLCVVVPDTESVPDSPCDVVG